MRTDGANENELNMDVKRQWLVGAWALVGAPTGIFLVAYLEKILSSRSGAAFLFVAAFLPGACIGFGLLAALSMVRSGWPRAVVACFYGAAIYVLTEAVANPVFSTHAEVWLPK